MMTHDERLACAMHRQILIVTRRNLGDPRTVSSKSQSYPTHLKDCSTAHALLRDDGFNGPMRPSVCQLGSGCPGSNHALIATARDGRSSHCHVRSGIERISKGATTAEDYFLHFIGPYGL